MMDRSAFFTLGDKTEVKFACDVSPDQARQRR
jgi:hypothetical protein